jgi:hypothetical protein
MAVCLGLRSFSTGNVAAPDFSGDDDSSAARALCGWLRELVVPLPAVIEHQASRF